MLGDILTHVVMVALALVGVYALGWARGRESACDSCLLEPSKDDRVAELEAELAAMAAQSDGRFEQVLGLMGQRYEVARERDAYKALLIRYRNEVPLGHQPPMIVHEVDHLLAGVRPVSYTTKEE